MGATLSLLERFTDKFVPEPMSGCWLWTAATTVQGYGKISVNGKLQLATRVSWRLHVGEIPDGLFMCHKCDTPACVNPDHLFLGTNRDNIRDAYKKGILGPGSSANSIDSDVVEAAVRAVDAGLSPGDAALLFRVSLCAVQGWIAGKRRRDVPIVAERARRNKLNPADGKANR